jgi:hypothetical protein
VVPAPTWAEFRTSGAASTTQTRTPDESTTTQKIAGLTFVTASALVSNASGGRNRRSGSDYELMIMCTPSASLAEGAGDIATVNAVAALVGM